MAMSDYRQCDVCGGKAFYDANLNYCYDPETGDNRLENVGSMAVVCRTCEATHEAVVVATAKANARLIAAAPDLLAACKAMAEWVNQRPDTHPVDAWRMCEAAIAKAEGRTDG